ncbi:class F sortase [Priestia flexa]
MKNMRWALPVICTAFLGLVGCSAQSVTTTAQPEPEKVKMAETKLTSSPPQASVNVSAPSQLTIPKLSIQAPIEKTGLTNDGQMDVPDNGNDVAWFEPGTKPGNEGNAVIAGHVDDKEGPAVFYNLHKLDKGDEIFVSDESGNVLTFVVTNKEAYPREDAPLREIFGPTFDHQLNLITCTGLFDRQNKTHEERLVVYTKLQDTKGANAQ